MSNKQMSYFDPGLIIKDVHEKNGKAVRTIDTKNAINGAFSHFRADYNVDENPTKISYFFGLTQQVTEVFTLNASSLNNKYFSIRINPSNKKVVIWYNVNNAGTQPLAGDALYIEVNLLSGDTARIVALATKLAIDFYSQYFTVEQNNNQLIIRTVENGAVDNSSAETTGFIVNTTLGTQETVKVVEIEYNGQNPIWEGQELIDFKYNLFTGLFEQNTTAQQDNIISELEKANESLDAIEADTDLIRIAVQSIDNDFDVPLSTRATEATQLDNKAELIKANASLDDIELRLETFNTDYGTVGVNTLRTAAQIGNSTGAADFNEAATTDQTLRTSSNQGLPNTIANAWTVKVTDGTDNVIFTPVKDEQHFNGSQFGAPMFGLDRTNPRKWRPIQIDTNGSISAHSVRADGGEVSYGAGATDIGTQRVTANITKNGTELDYGDGATNSATIRTTSNVKFDGTTPTRNAGVSDANTQRVSANITRNGTELSYNIGNADENTLRVASQLQNGTAAADYNAGLTGANTLRTASNIYGFDGTNLRQILTDNLGSAKVHNTINVSGLFSALTVGTTAVEVKVGATALANRKVVTLTNTSLVTFYWGYSNTVTTTTGTPIFANQTVTWEVGPNVTIFVIAATAGNNSRITEGA